MNKTKMKWILLLGVCIFTRPLYALQIIAGPCLQNASETSITILWVTDKNCTSWVEYGTDPLLGQKAVHSQYGLIDADRQAHKVTVTGLSPGTTCHYKVCSKEIEKFDPYKVTYGQTVSSPVFSFTTFNRQKDDVSFIVVNDIHGNDAVLTKLLKVVRDKPYDLVFLNGDILSYLVSQQQIIDRVIRPCTESFAAHIPLVYVRGNHEARGKFARMLPDYFILPDNRYYGSFDDGPIHFIVMDSGEDKENSHEEFSGLADSDRYRDEQRIWLEKEIQSEAFKKAPFRVVLIHMPIDSRFELGYGQQDYREKWGPLLEQGKVDAMISGHTHEYEIVAPKPGEHSYPVIIGGGPLKKEGGAGFNKTTAIRVDANTDTLKMTILSDEGKILDSYTAEKR